MPPLNDWEERAAAAAKLNHGIPRTVWHVVYTDGFDRHIMRERNEGPPCTGRSITHVLTTDGFITVRGGEFPRVWPPPFPEREVKADPSQLGRVTPGDDFLLGAEPLLFVEGAALNPNKPIEFKTSYNPHGLNPKLMTEAQRAAYYAHIRAMYDRRDIMTGRTSGATKPRPHITDFAKRAKEAGY